MSTSGPGNRVIILILGALATVSPFSIDMYLPAFSQIAADMGSTEAKVSLSITTYFIGFAIGQLLYGPLLDRYGRKKPLYYGLIFYILASAGCMQSQTVEILMAFRFVQALGGCVAMVAAMTMVRDFFPVEESAKILSLLILIIGLSPLLAPTIGGFVTAWLGWEWVFIVLSLMVLLILIVTWLFLPQKYIPDPGVSLKAKPMLVTFYTILKQPKFYTYTLSGAFSFATLFIYVAGSPLIFMGIFNVSPQAYGGIFALLSVGFIGSNQLNILLLRRYSSERIFRLALISQVLTGMVFLAGAWYGWYGLTATIVLLFISLSCLGLTYPNASALALSPFTKNVGSAAALLGFLQIGVAGLVSGGVGLLNVVSSVPIVAMMLITAVIALLILITGSKKPVAEPVQQQV